MRGSGARVRRVLEVVAESVDEANQACMVRAEWSAALPDTSRRRGALADLAPLSWSPWAVRASSCRQTTPYFLGCDAKAALGACPKLTINEV
jgi:hypothetical protein